MVTEATQVFHTSPPGHLLVHDAGDAPAPDQLQEFVNATITFSILRFFHALKKPVAISLLLRYNKVL